MRCTDKHDLHTPHNNPDYLNSPTFFCVRWQLSLGTLSDAVPHNLVCPLSEEIKGSKQLRAQGLLHNNRRGEA